MGVLGRYKDYYKKNEAYLQGQLGNPEGPQSPTKNFMIHGYGCAKAKRLFLKRLETAFEDLNCINRNA